MARPAERTTRDIVPAKAGHGPLLQRDYWAVIAECRISPAAVIDELARHFREYPPEALVRFRHGNGEDAPLGVGDDVDVEIRGAGRYRVRVTHRDRQSITLATLRGHPEAGRITFGAYRNADGDVVFHIRSRARSSSRLRYFGFLAAGDPMQTNTWVDLIGRLAAVVGSGVAGAIHAEKRKVPELPEDREVPGPPTYIATGG